jgi:hypothetical protein
MVFFVGFGGLGRVTGRSMGNVHIVGLVDGLRAENVSFKSSFQPFKHIAEIKSDRLALNGGRCVPGAEEPRRS